MSPILQPHYVQTGAAPAVTGAGFGLFGCSCGQSLLIAGYEPRNFLGIALRCAACGLVSETPGLPLGIRPPESVTLIERGAEQPPAAIDANTVLISREEMQRLAQFFLPRKTDTDPHVISLALLEDVEKEHLRWTGVPLDPAPAGYQDQALAWAVAHWREKLRLSDQAGFETDTDMVATTVIASFRDLFASWVHHPLFAAMIGSAVLRGFDLHATSIFATAKVMALAGNPLTFVTTTTTQRPRVIGLRSGQGENTLSIAVNPFTRFEWPHEAGATPQAVRAAVIEAMAAAQGSINRVKPGILVLSPGAASGAFDAVLTDALSATVASHGRRHRGLAAVAAILPKIWPTGNPREVRFGHMFYPYPNRHHESGKAVRIGSRADHAGFR